MAGRRAFLRDAVGRLAREVTTRTERRIAPRHHFRPPGAVDELAFLASCTRCGDCIDACPVHAIFKAPSAAGLAAGTPVLEPAVQACAVCADMPCTRACDTGALFVPFAGWAAVRMGALSLDPGRCIAFHGAACGVCARACPVGERALALDVGGRPVLRPEGCVGCGTCVTVCVTAPSSLHIALGEDV